MLYTAVSIFIDHNPNMVRQEKTGVLDWLKHQAYGELQRLQDRVSNLTTQNYSLSTSLNQNVKQLRYKQLGLNAAERRLQELEHALQQSEKSRANCENDLQAERSAHAWTKKHLSQVLAQHCRADNALAQQSQAIENLSKYLELIQGISQDEEASMGSRASRDDIGAMIMELEDKTQTLAELEGQRKQEHAHEHDDNSLIEAGAADDSAHGKVHLFTYFGEKSLNSAT